jgi:hypothetical protein
MGASGVDVLLSSAALKLFPASVECKSLARVSIYKFYEQAATNCIEGTVPIVVIKQNRSDPLVILSFKDFMEKYESQSCD